MQAFGSCLQAGPIENAYKTAMATSTVERHSGLEGLQHDLRQAFDRAEQAGFQAGLEWYQLQCATAIEGDERAHLHVLRRDGKLKAALPMLSKGPGDGSELRALANFYTTRFDPPLANDVEIEDLADLLRDLRIQAPRASRIEIAPLDRAGRTYDLLHSAMKRAGLVTFEYFCFGNWYMTVAGDCDSYMAARPGEVRSTLRRMSKRLSQAGARIEIVDSAGDIDSAIAAYSEVYASSWKQAEPFVDFMPGLIRLCATKGWLRMGIAWLEDKPIAAQLWVVANGKASIFKLAYDSAYASYSPGTVLTSTLMRQVIDIDHVVEVDYLTGDDAYKQAWMSHRREMWGLVGYDPRQLRGALLATREWSARSVKSLLRQVEILRGRRVGQTQQP